jgi:hypothetical protein
MNPRHTALAMLPLAMGLVTEGFHSMMSPAPTAPTVTAGTTARKVAAKQFSVPLATLQEWAKSVVVSLDNVSVEGSSTVHSLANDCEIHFGAHAAADFDGVPNGLVLEPMNACVEDPPEGFASWPAFAKSLQAGPITATGVARIWPEHLEGGVPSNPDHAVELHPLTGVVSAGKSFDFSANIFAGDYRGKDGNRDIVSRVHATVTASEGVATISFVGGSIGNFTTLDLLIDRSSITSDGAGSFRMNGTVALNDAAFPVRIVTVKGSPINASMPAIQKRSGPTEEIDGALVLYSLSPQALLDAANQSHGQGVEAGTPVQLILYGEPE